MPTRGRGADCQLSHAFVNQCNAGAIDGRPFLLAIKGGPLVMQPKTVSREQRADRFA